MSVGSHNGSAVISGVPYGVSRRRNYCCECARKGNLSYYCECVCVCVCECLCVFHEEATREEARRGGHEAERRWRSGVTSGNGGATLGRHNLRLKYVIITYDNLTAILHLRAM